MLCPLADNAEPAVSAVSSDHATLAVGFLRVPLKPGRKSLGLSKEQRRARHAAAARACRKRKQEADADLVDSEKKAKEDLAAAREEISALRACLARATAENLRLRGVKEEAKDLRELDAMAAELEAEAAGAVV